MTEHPAISAICTQLRVGQQELANWREGRLAVSAVPGAGKSTGMAAAAAITIARHQLHSRRQLIVVTFTRSAAANIKAKILSHLKEWKLPVSAFAVHTLHGLAFNIASRHPNLSKINVANTSLINPNQEHRLIRNSVDQWIANHSSLYRQLVIGTSFDGEETERLRRQSLLRTEVLPKLAYTVIREAKSSGLHPVDLRSCNTPVTQGEDNLEYEILHIAAGLYESYQTQLAKRQLIDYDDMILAALRVLEDPDARQFWQTQIFAVFEDEAQDSTPLQTRLLEILASDPQHPKHQNLIRVGDSNQAINSTFTPADPLFFREFCKHCADENRLILLDHAGRSSLPIIETANFVCQWVNQSSQGEKTSTQGDQPDSGSFPQVLPFTLQFIHPVSANDPQPNANPPAMDGGVELVTPKDIQETIEFIGQRLVTLMTRTPQAQVAILVRTNEQGRYVAQSLQQGWGNQLRIYDVGQRERQSQIPREILALLRFIHRPQSPDYVKSALEVLAKRQLIGVQDLDALACQPEQFLYPGPLDTPPANNPQMLDIEKARHYGCNLLKARLQLPPYHLISFLALTLNYDKSELATADKLADRIARQTYNSSEFDVILTVLNQIVESERFEPVEVDDSDSRYTRCGQVTVITMHKAKGLDWDYVFLPFLYQKNILPPLRVPPSSSFLGNFTLSEIARAQIRALVHHQPIPTSSQAWSQAQSLQQAESYRLLYVAITRAKQLLWMATEQSAPYHWSDPQQLQAQSPCSVVVALTKHQGVHSTP